MKKEKYISVRNKPSGTRFQVFINYKDADGNKQTFSKTINSKDYQSKQDALAAAKIIRDTALIEIAQNRLINHAPTVKELYDAKWDLFNLSVKTKKKHNCVYRYSVKHLEAYPLNEITKSMLQTNINDYAYNHSQDQINLLITIWKQIYLVAQIKELPIPDKTLSIVRPKSKKIVIPKSVELSDQDFIRFIEAIDKHKTTSKRTTHRYIVIKYLLMIMFYTGARPSEVLAITSKDIDLVNNHLKINKAIGSTKTSQKQVITTKTFSSVRDIPINYELSLVLKDLLKWSKNKLLLSDYDGSPMEIDTVTDYIGIISRESGIEFNSYRLRHRFATDLVSSGVNARIAQDLMGHTSFSMTLEYSRSSKTDRANAINSRSIKNRTETEQKLSRN